MAKDSEAAELITQVIGSQPDVVYLLTQAVLLQETAMRRLQQQVSELQAKVHSKKVSSLPFWVGHVNRIQMNRRPMHGPTLLGKAVF